MRIVLVVIALSGCLDTTSNQQLAYVTARDREFPIVATAPGRWSVLADRRLYRCAGATVAACQAAIDRALPPLPPPKPATAAAPGPAAPPAPGTAP